MKTLLLGIKLITPCKFIDLVEPDDQGRGWRAKVEPSNEAIDNYEFRFLVIASGKNVPLEGKKKYSEEVVNYRISSKISLGLFSFFALFGGAYFRVVLIFEWAYFLFQKIFLARTSKKSLSN